jgi:hypothetical protein
MWQSEILKNSENELKPAELILEAQDLEDKFAYYNKLNLGDFINKYANKICSENLFSEETLNAKCGNILMSLKLNNNINYKRVLNEFGYKSFCKFRIKKNKINQNMGIYFFEYKSDLKYIGSTKQTFIKRINNGYGNISPRNCYLGGQSTNCKINSNLNLLLHKGDWKDLRFYVLPMTDKEQIISTEKRLIRKCTSEKKYNLWNTQHSV